MGSSLEMVSHGEYSNGSGGECGSGHSDGEVLIVGLFFVFIIFFDNFFLGFEEVFLLNSGQPSPGLLGDSIHCGFGGSDITTFGGDFVETAGVDNGSSLSDGISDVAGTAVVIYTSTNYVLACSLASDGVRNIKLSKGPGI